MKKIQEESFGIIPLLRESNEWSVLLILHKGGKHWSFPKGHGNPGETPIDTASRELKEETGLDVQEFLTCDPLTESYTFYRKNEFVMKKVTYFSATVSGNLILQKEEVIDSKWVSVKEALNFLTFKEARNICQALISKLYENL